MPARSAARCDLLAAAQERPHHQALPRHAPAQPLRPRRELSARLSGSSPALGGCGSHKRTEEQSSGRKGKKHTARAMRVRTVIEPAPGPPAPDRGSSQQESQRYATSTTEKRTKSIHPTSFIHQSQPPRPLARLSHMLFVDINTIGRKKTDAGLLLCFCKETRKRRRQRQRESRGARISLPHRTHTESQCIMSFHPITAAHKHQQPCACARSAAVV